MNEGRREAHEIAAKHRVEHPAAKQGGLLVLQRLTLFIDEQPTTIDDADGRILLQDRNLLFKFRWQPDIVRIEKGDKPAARRANAGVLGRRLAYVFRAH